MAFPDAKVTVVPGLNRGPALVILHDPTTTAAVIAASGNGRANWYFSGVNALPNLHKALRERTEADYAVQRRYDSILGAVKNGRDRPANELLVPSTATQTVRGAIQNLSKNTIGAVLIAIGSDATPVMKRLAVVNAGYPGDRTGRGGFYDQTKQAATPSPSNTDPTLREVGIPMETIWPI